MPSIRSSFLLGVLALVLFSCSALAGALPIGPQQAVAADETGEEPTTPTEEPPPVVETPTEPEPTPEPETPVTTPPVTTPPVGVPSGGESGGGSVETPKSTPSTGSEASSGGGGGGAGGGGGGGGSSGSGASGGGATIAPATPNHHTARAPTHTGTRNTGGGGGGGGSATGGGGGSKTATGGGGTRNTGGGGGQHAPSHSGGGPAPQPTVSTQGIDEGASAVTNVATHVGEVFAEALPTAPLKEIGDRLAAHIAGAGSAPGGKGEKAAAEGIGTALGAALIGSAVAVDKAPVANSSPIPFFTPPGGKSGTIYLILIAALLLAVGALVIREIRSSLGLDAPRTAVRVADERPRIPLKERIGVALVGTREATHHWFSRFRRLRSSAAAGLRSLF